MATSVHPAMKDERICPQCRRSTHAPTCPDDGFATITAARFKVSDVDPRLGRVLDGRYRIESAIGRGGFGAVYRGVHIGIGRAVAIKVLSRELGASLTEIARFQQEARALASLEHRNIVAVYDFGQTDDGELYLVMEYVDGRTLDAVIAEDGPLAAEDAAELGRQVLDGLAEAHAQGIVHRDLKPANLIVTTGPRGRPIVKILDFGIARVTSDAGAGMTLTRTGVVIGSPPYMSPEQCAGRAVGPASDLYAVGCILYECLTGRRIFDLPTPTAFLVAHVTEPPDAPSLAGQPLQGPLVDVILALLAKQPEDRPVSAEAAQALLREALARPLALTPADTRRGAAPPVRARRGVLLGLVLVASAAAATLVFVLAGDDARSRPEVPPTATRIAQTIPIAHAPDVRQSPPPPPLIAPDVAAPDTIGAAADTTGAAPEVVAEVAAEAAPYTVELASEPPATVMQGEVVLGTTPHTFVWARDTAPPTVTLVAKGHVEQVVTLAPEQDGGRQTVTLLRKKTTQRPNGATGPAW